ncbi:MAG: ribonuclease HII [Candidatus Auribacterota bacterium]|jgi:ribonuclease HII|uniref:Ribonuclease HII n=1 Tax=Candidatus Auribacter fodinae TaxID=2093366 RepID=A0A3A4R312_9BACT|nr:MAG: ribonuclease HII [Candidatus Auribacter fodinae]
MLEYEQHYRSHGKNYIAGLDEVGRGPLAGPVVACAVVLPESFFHEGINDSKQVAESKRKSLFKEIISHPAIDIGIGLVSERVIDSVNILQATRIAMWEAVCNLAGRPDHLLIDGLLLEDCQISQTKIIKGDARSLSIASASIIAKVVRDSFMEYCDTAVGGYNFARHKGYGTTLHIEALRKIGASWLHRRSFAPVNIFIGGAFT